MERVQGTMKCLIWWPMSQIVSETSKISDDVGRNNGRERGSCCCAAMEVELKVDARLMVFSTVPRYKV